MQTDKQAAWITAYCDGGSRGNPGPAGYGVYLEDEQGQKVDELYEFLGVKTNNFAEYSGLLAALDFALEEGHARLRVVADSELMVKQIQGKYRVNSPDLRPLYDEAKRRIAKLSGFKIEHVLRGKNKHADRLANLAMDEGTRKTVRRTATPTVSSASSTLKAAPGLTPPGSTGPGSPASPQSVSGAAPKTTPKPTTGSLFPASEPADTRPILGFVKGGVVHLVEGELPEGIFVRITPTRR
jgi:ribonuclease HI